MSLEAIAKKNAPGILISFEGGDGSGKSTHVKFLAGLLESLGFSTVLAREPGGTRIGERLREIVLDVGSAGLSSRSELLIYEAARAQLIDEVIKPALKAGSIVLCDRFTDSTFAYQGYGRGIPLGFIGSVNDFATDGITPDATIVLSCDDRAEKKDRVFRRIGADRLELAGDDFHSNVIRAFRDIAEKEPDRIKVIDTAGKHSETAKMIFSALSDVFPWLANGQIDLTAELASYDAAHGCSKIGGMEEHGEGAACQSTSGSGENG